MKIIGITGYSGFVGSNLIPYLVAQNQFSTRKIDLRNNPDFSDVIGFDTIIHLAGKAHDLKSVSKPDEYYAINFELTKGIYNAFIKSDAKKLIFVSSVKASSDIVVGELTESDVPIPETHYGKSKLLAEAYIRNQPLPEGKSYYILRPCMIHGPGNKGNLNLLYNLVSKGLPWPLGAYENKRSFCSIENLCFIIKELIEQEDIPSGVFNVADDEALSTNQLIKLIAKSQNKSPIIWKISKSFINVLAKVGDKLYLPLNSERLHKLTESYVVSTAKIKHTLGKELPVSAKDGLLKTFKSFSEHA